MVRLRDILENSIGHSIVDLGKSLRPDLNIMMVVVAVAQTHDSRL